MAWTVRTRWLNARRRAWARRAKQPGGLLYLALGDSAAQGIGTATLDSSYVGLLGARLQRHSGRTVQIVNPSRHGARLKDVIVEQLPLLDEYEPDLVTLSSGANDMRFFELDAFRAQYETILSQIPQHTIVADLPCFYFGDRERDAQRASRIIVDLVAAHRMPFAPMHRVTAHRAGRGSFADFTWDQFHPSARGYRVWESAFAGAVAKRARALG